jgi:hypothetical protein
MCVYDSIYDCKCVRVCVCEWRYLEGAERCVVFPRSYSLGTKYETMHPNKDPSLPELV